MEKISEIDLILGVNEKKDIVAYIEKFVQEKEQTEQGEYSNQKNFTKEKQNDVTEKTIVDDTKNISKTGNNVYESDKYIFSVSDMNMTEMKKLDLNIEILKDYFSAIK